MQIVRIDVPNNIRNTYESSLLSQAYNSRFKVDRIMETCANLHFIPCRSDLGTMKKLEIAREWFPVIRRRPTINSWD